MLKENIKFILLFLFLTLGYCLFSCDDDGCTNPTPIISGDEEKIREIEEISRDTVLLDEQKVFLAAEVWRNMMPTTDTDCDYRGLIVKLDIKSSSNFLFLDMVEFKKLYAIQNNKMWIAEVKDENEEENGSIVFRDGPEWEVGSTIDIYFEITKDGNKKILRKVNVEIAGPE